MAQKDLTGLQEIHALLGRGTEFEGVLSFEGRVRIDGRFKGSIVSEGILVLGDGADVEANIEVGTLIVRGGSLRGPISARQLVEVHAEGRVFGDITAPQIDIDKGCVFEGRCSMPGASIAPPPPAGVAEFVSEPEASATAEDEAPETPEPSDPPA